ncbi:MAG: hypothetical protein ACE5GJ_08430 [Gemmatimonadota bacterium]
MDAVTRATREFTTVKLRPNPLALQGLEVLVDRFERRRRFYAGPVRVLDQRRLLRSSYATSLDLLRAQIPFARPCIFDPTALCYRRRGQEQVMSVCIDDVPVWGGTLDLEIYDRGREVRLYTRGFVEDHLRSGRRLQLLSWGCGLSIDASRDLR